MKNIVVLFCFLFVSCASTAKIAEQPLKYSYLPEKLDIDILMPPNTNIVDTSLMDFKSIPIDSGRLTTIYRDTLQLHPGILFSEKKAALFIYYRNNGEYLDKKLTLVKKLYNDYYDNSLEAEKVYQNEIKNLNKKVERTWLEKNIVYFGFIAGLATAILTEFAIIQTAK
ncbi:MAG: hypothetical protein PHF86_13325 [Candidatus Nanoarchaeia archaeon]|jgi:hypothetical protein|nr:hypothetical protein [Candidatus Nanoarchaeia archaeon]